MGYDRHHAIIVTTFDDDAAEGAHEMARSCFAFAPELVTPLRPAAMNGWRSFAVLPDGSKEGWTDSDAGDYAREALIGYLDRQRYSDGSSPLNWCEVQFGDDDGDNRLLRDDESVRQVLR